MIGPFYLHPDTARRLLAESRLRTARLRAERDLRLELRQRGWSDSACAELAQIHLNLNGTRQHG